MRESKYFYRVDLSWDRRMFVPFFLIVFFAGCSLSPMNVAGTYVSIDPTHRADTLFLFSPAVTYAFGLPEGRSVYGRYHHVYHDSTGAAHTHDSDYILSHLPDDLRHEGAFMAQLEGWRFPNNADSLQDFWVVTLSHDSLKVWSFLPEEPVYLQIAQVIYHSKPQSSLFSW